MDEVNERMETGAKAPETITTQEGLILDVDTGEVLGVQSPEGIDGGMDEGLAFWALKKIGRLESGKAVAVDALHEASEMIRLKQAEALDALARDPEYVQAQAIVANCDAIIVRADKGLKWMSDAWLERLGAYAAGRLTGSARTWATPFGSVSLHRQPAKLRVGSDEDLAIRSAERLYPKTVKKTFQVSGLTKAERAALLDNPLTAEELGLEVVPSWDKASIQTGVTA